MTSSHVVKRCLYSPWKISYFRTRLDINQVFEKLEVCLKLGLPLGNETNLM